MHLFHALLVLYHTASNIFCCAKDVTPQDSKLSQAVLEYTRTSRFTPSTCFPFDPAPLYSSTRVDTLQRLYSTRLVYSPRQSSTTTLHHTLIKMSSNNQNDKGQGKKADKQKKPKQGRKRDRDSDSDSNHSLIDPNVGAPAPKQVVSRDWMVLAC